MTKIEIVEAKGVSVCGEGCCHDDGLLINKITKQYLRQLNFNW